MKPKYRLCWWCNRQLWGNKHRVITVHGHEVIVHAACEKETKSSDAQ